MSDKKIYYYRVIYTFKSQDGSTNGSGYAIVESSYPLEYNSDIKAIEKFIVDNVSNVEVCWLTDWHELKGYDRP